MAQEASGLQVMATGYIVQYELLGTDLSECTQVGHWQIWLAGSCR